MVVNEETTWELPIKHNINAYTHRKKDIQNKYAWLYIK